MSTRDTQQLQSVPVNSPMEEWLRMDRMPHIWCPGCGIGTAVNCFVRAVGKAGIPREKLAIVSNKPQTTRHRLVGILSEDGGQMVFLHAMEHGAQPPFGVKIDTEGGLLGREQGADVSFSLESGDSIYLGVDRVIAFLDE